MKSERGQLFSLEDDLSPNSGKPDGIAWSRWNIYVLAEVEKHISDPQQALDTFHAYTKLNRSRDYESGLNAIDCARKIVGVDEQPMATLVRT